MPMGVDGILYHKLPFGSLSFVHVLTVCRSLLHNAITSLSLCNIVVYFMSVNVTRCHGLNAVSKWFAALNQESRMVY